MRTTSRWIGYCGPEFRQKLVDTVLTLDAHATLTISTSAYNLRSDVLQTPGAHVVIGSTEDDVSEVNLAAAVVADGAAGDVTLVVARASGSFKSRALTAGVADVIDLSQFALAARPEFGRRVTVVPGQREAAPMAASSRGPAAMRIPPKDRCDERTSVLGAGGSDEATSVLGVSRSTRGPAVHAVPERVPSDRYQAAPSCGAVEREFSSEEELDGVSPCAQSDSIERGDAPILVFVSGRGGVGKTTMAAASACIAASWGMHVALCDVDFSCGNLYAAFGLPRPADLSPLADGRPVDVDRIEHMGLACAEGVRLWGGCARPEMAEAVWPHTSELLCAASLVSDLVIVDTSSTFTDAVAQAAQLCDRLLITIDGRPGSTAAQSRLGALAVRLGVARTRIARVVNRCDPRGRDETVINRADVGLETARSHRVLEGGESVNEFFAAGQVNALTQDGSPFAASLATCLAQLLSEVGRLPGCTEAQSALEARQPRRRRLFGRRKEAV